MLCYLDSWTMGKPQNPVIPNVVPLCLALQTPHAHINQPKALIAHHCQHSCEQPGWTTGGECSKLRWMGKRNSPLAHEGCPVREGGSIPRPPSPLLRYRNELGNRSFVLKADRTTFVHLSPFAMFKWCGWSAVRKKAWSFGFGHKIPQKC
jgi:hypothetical protein